MNSREQQLKRLFKSARHAAKPEPRLSWAGELAVLAAWRKARERAEAFDWLPLLHRAVAVACVIAVIVAATSITLKPNPPASDELSSVNDAVNFAAAWL
jgi:hypothetical protein